ncbi:hypothetical protein DL89DRAFT_270193, partial [Linderina pennispora]
ELRRKIMRRHNSAPEHRRLYGICKDVLDVRKKLHRHSHTHDDMYQTIYYNDVVLSFVRTSDDHIICRCGKMPAVGIESRQHTQTCSDCITEAYAIVRSSVSTPCNTQPSGLSPTQSQSPSHTEGQSDGSETTTSSSNTSGLPAILPATESIIQESNERSPLGNVGLFLHSPHGLLVCCMCERAIINRKPASHFYKCIASAKSDIDAAVRYLKSYPYRVCSTESAKTWLGSCKGKAISRIPSLPVTKVLKCTVCGYLSDNRVTLNSHFSHEHRGMQSPATAPVVSAQQLFSKRSFAKYVEVSD